MVFNIRGMRLQPPKASNPRNSRSQAHEHAAAVRPGGKWWSKRLYPIWSDPSSLSIRYYLLAYIATHTQIYIYNHILYIYMYVYCICSQNICPALAGSSMSFIGALQEAPPGYVPNPRAKGEETDGYRLWFVGRLLPSIDIFRMFIPQTVWPHLGFLP